MRLDLTKIVIKDSSKCNSLRRLVDAPTGTAKKVKDLTHGEYLKALHWWRVNKLTENSLNASSEENQKTSDEIFCLLMAEGELKPEGVKAMCEEEKKPKKRAFVANAFATAKSSVAAMAPNIAGNSEMVATINNVIDSTISRVDNLEVEIHELRDKVAKAVAAADAANAKGDAALAAADAALAAAATASEKGDAALAKGDAALAKGDAALAAANASRKREAQLQSELEEEKRQRVASERRVNVRLDELTSAQKLAADQQAAAAAAAAATTARSESSARRELQLTNERLGTLSDDVTALTTHVGDLEVRARQLTAAHADLNSEIVSQQAKLNSVVAEQNKLCEQTEQTSRDLAADLAADLESLEKGQRDSEEQLRAAFQKQLSEQKAALEQAVAKAKAEEEKKRQELLRKVQENAAAVKEAEDDLARNRALAEQAATDAAKARTAAKDAKANSLAAVGQARGANVEAGKAYKAAAEATKKAASAAGDAERSADVASAALHRHGKRERELEEEQKRAEQKVNRLAEGQRKLEEASKRQAEAAKMAADKAEAAAAERQGMQTTIGMQQKQIEGMQTTMGGMLGTITTLKADHELSSSTLFAWLNAIVPQLDQLSMLSQNFVVGSSMMRNQMDEFGAYLQELATKEEVDAKFIEMQERMIAMIAALRTEVEKAAADSNERDAALEQLVTAFATSERALANADKLQFNAALAKLAEDLAELRAETDASPPADGGSGGSNTGPPSPVLAIA